MVKLITIKFSTLIPTYNTTIVNDGCQLSDIYYVKHLICHHSSSSSPSHLQSIQNHHQQILYQSDSLFNHIMYTTLMYIQMLRSRMQTHIILNISIIAMLINQRVYVCYIYVLTVRCIILMICDIF